MDGPLAATCPFILASLFSSFLLTIQTRSVRKQRLLHKERSDVFPDPDQDKNGEPMNEKHQNGTPFDLMTGNEASFQPGQKFSITKFSISIFMGTLFSLGLSGVSMGWHISRVSQSNRQVEPVQASILESLCWIYALFVSMKLLRTRAANRSFRLVIHIAFIYLFAVASAILLFRVDLDNYLRHGDFKEAGTTFPLIISIIRMISMSTVFSISLITPRGPPLIWKGAPVNPMAHSNLLRIASFQFCFPLLRSTYKAGRINGIKDLAACTFPTRSRDLYETIAGRMINRDTLLPDGSEPAVVDWKTKNSLIKAIFRANAKYIAAQAGLAMVAAVTFYSPAYFMNGLLEFIERKAVNNPPVSRHEEAQGYWWVFGLLASKLVVAFITSALWYVSSSILQLRLKGQLNSAIYAKTLRRKDVIGTHLDDDTEEKSPDAKDGAAKEIETQPAQNINGKKAKTAEEATEKGAKDGKQNVLNLMAVDADRISTFATWAFSIIDAPIEVLVGIYFLYHLLGWSAFFGLAFMIFTLPLNHLTGQLYSKAQDRLMEGRDRRVSLMNEVLQGIRMIKFNAWEKNLAKRILKLRDMELSQVKKVFIYDVCFHALWMGVPVIITVLSFLSFTKVQGRELTPSIAFVSITVFAELRFALNIVPELIIQGAQAIVSIRRIERYLASQEICVDDIILRPAQTSISENNTFCVILRDATISWPVDDRDKLAASGLSTHGAPTPANNTFALRNISMEIPRDSLTLVVGPTGSGKTLLLLGLLGEAELLSGQVIAPRSEMDPVKLPDFIPSDKWIKDDKVAYVAQTAWLQNKSIRDNILFGLPYAKARYEESLRACALIKDLEIFEDGDGTEIGEKGITLSGGQKARVALARAIYSRAKYLFMDDILSAVDAHTAAHIYENCLRGKLLQGRTTILVTHHVKLCLPAANYIIALNNGIVTLAGSPDELRESDRLTEVIKELKQSENSKNASEAGTSSSDTSSPPHTQEKTIEDIADEAINGENTVESKKLKKTPRKLVEEENREVGIVKPRVYGSYFKLTGGYFYWFVFLVAFVGAQSLQVMETWWLRVWSSSYASEFTTNPPHVMISSTLSFEKMGLMVQSFALALPAWMNKPMNPYASSLESHTVDYYLWIYVAICFGNIFISTIRWGVMYFGSIKASRTAYENLLSSILRAPIRFFDTTPIGRILNRFAKDFETFDSTLPTELAWLTLCIFASIAIVIVCTSITPVFLVGVILISGLYYTVGVLYTYASRELRRHDSTSKSPIYSQYSETLVGVGTIRAFGASARFMKEMMKLIEDNIRVGYYLWTVNRWMSIWFSIFGGVIAWLAGILALGSVIDAGLAGFSISFAIQLTDNLFWGARHYTALELAMVAYERILEYTELTQEPPSIMNPRPPASWPSDGSIAVEKLEIRYAPELDPVLKDVSFEVQGGEKVGIVGRTGSGKSTLSISLFRFVEPSAGKIYIDGFDITQIGLEDLRSSLTVVEQEPTLLSGTIRSNLDPFDEHYDEELFEALRRVHLLGDLNEQEQEEGTNGIETMEGANFNVFSDLDTSVSDNGKDFSNGQRQLLCLARSLLKRSKIVIMDEATASVDFNTDRLIQEAIRSEFSDRTLLVVAHRLTTIADYDRILVLDGGRVAEFDTPLALMKREDSIFGSMCRKSGEWDILFRMASGDNNPS